MRATFVFPNSRSGMLERIAAGTEPDSTLFGANYLEAEGIEARIHDPWLTRRPLEPPLGRIAWNLRELTVPLEIGRSDVLFTPLANTLPLAARARGIPPVVVNFGLNLIRRRASGARRLLFDRSLRSCARVICLADSQRTELVDAVGLPDDRAITMRLPIDDRFFTPRAVGSGDGGVLTVGKDLARDYRSFIDAVGQLDVRAKLVVYPRNLAGLVLPPNAEAAVLSAPDLREAYAAATCIVLPQHPDDYPYGCETGGLTALMEAMAMGKPVVATERAAVREYIEDGVDGLLVPPEDPAALREAIGRVLGDRVLAARLGAAARARVERAHTTRGFTPRLAQLFRDVV